MVGIVIRHRVAVLLKGQVIEHDRFGRLVLGETGERLDGWLSDIIALRVCDGGRSVCVMLSAAERPWVSIPLGFLPGEAQRRSCAEGLCALLRADETAK